MIAAIHDALYCSKICSYAQGFQLMRTAQQEFNWKLSFGDIARIWRGGCIIRARFLNRITEAYRAEPALRNLMLAPFFADVAALLDQLEGLLAQLGAARQQGHLCIEAAQLVVSLGYIGLQGQQHRSIARLCGLCIGSGGVDAIGHALEQVNLVAGRHAALPHCRRWGLRACGQAQGRRVALLAVHAGIQPQPECRRARRQPGQRGWQQLRGGIGLFQGDAPQVWVGNAYSNTGMNYISYQNYTNPALVPFSADGLNQNVPPGGAG